MPEAIESDADRWKRYTRRQRFGVIAAGTLTLVRPLAAAWFARRLMNRSGSSWRDTLIHGAICATDKADGAVARHFDAVTNAGKIGDAAVDKAANNMAEIVLASQRGPLAIILAAMRLARDVGVSVARWQIAGDTNGQVSVAARPIGQINTAARNTVTCFGVSPLAERAPRISAAADIGVTILTVYSGVRTVMDMRSAAREFKDQQP